MLLVDVALSVIARRKCPRTGLGELGRRLCCCCNGWGLERRLLMWHGSVLPVFGVVDSVHVDVSSGKSRKEERKQRRISETCATEIYIRKRERKRKREKQEKVK